MDSFPTSKLVRRLELVRGLWQLKETQGIFLGKSDMAEDPHYYVAGYSVEDDPYSQPNGVLINYFGIDNTRDLEEIEATSAARNPRAFKQPSRRIRCSDTQKIHYEIFCDVYPWAGEFRKVDIAKGETFFEANTNIEGKLDELLPPRNPEFLHWSVRRRLCTSSR